MNSYGKQEQPNSYNIERIQCMEYTTAIDWDEINHQQEVSVSKNYEGNSLIEVPDELLLEYKTPFVRPYREVSYRVAWWFFEDKWL